MEGYIYKITSPSGKIYIGQTINIDRRKNDYARLDCDEQIKIYRSLLKYGWNNHLFEIIEQCEIEKLNSLETYWIKKFDCMNNGLNCTEGGDSKKLSQETKDKISVANKGKLISQETKNKLSNALKGKNKGKKRTKEQIIKMSQVMIGKFIGRKWTEEQTKKRKELKLTEETKRKISEAHIGKEAHNKKKVNAFIYETGEYVGTYNSYTECAKYLNISSSKISAVILGKRKQTNGYIFENIQIL